MFKLRIKYHKEYHLRFVAHLEMVRLMERVFRRMKLPLKYTEGFNPHPRISFASPLSVGVESVAELLDVELTQKVGIEEFLEASRHALPKGLTFEKAKYVEDKRSLMSLVAWAEYEVRVDCLIEAWRFKEIIHAVLAMESIPVIKKGGKSAGKTMDIRPMIKDVSVIDNPEGATLRMILANGSGGSLKPELLLETMQTVGETELSAERIIRTNLFMMEDERLVDLLELN